MGLRLKQIVFLLSDIFLVNLAVYIMLQLRFDGYVPDYFTQAFWSLVPYISAIFVFSFIVMRLYNRIWEHASIPEMLSILRGTSIAMAALVLIVYFFNLPGLPRSVYLGSWVFINVNIGASRIWYRVFRDYYKKRKNKECSKVLIIGAGDAGSIIIREIQSNRSLGLHIAGVIDDDPQKRHLTLHGVSILGNRKDIESAVNDLSIDEIIIAIPSVFGEDLREIVEICKRTSARLRILPGIYQSASADNSMLHKLREVQMEDLLKRNPVKLNLSEIANYVGGKTVLVTGAGGSIGSELCRQLLQFSPQKLVILDNSENNLFEIEIDLKSYKTPVHIWTELVDVRLQDRLEGVFRQHRPEVVFHAAAFKHVPMMQRHPDLALNNNVIGTRNTALLADRYAVETFIFISTDKAVNPTSIMGASKRIAELVVKDINRNSRTKFASVRFGNVLGSRGSVIPTFIKQLQKGGPVTVTHPEMKRFFMTIPEAAQLVIEAGALAKGGEVFVLDMGEMIKIDDLARELIKLSGYVPDRDIRIVYTGMRPGEKLYEELFTNPEEMVSTSHERIFISRKELDDCHFDLTKSIALLLRSSLKDKAEVLNIIMQFVPEFQGEHMIVLDNNTKQKPYLVSTN